MADPIQSVTTGRTDSRKENRSNVPKRGELPTFPAGMTRGDVIDALGTLHGMAVRGERLHNPSFEGWPDIDALLAHIPVHGIPSIQEAITTQTDEANLAELVVAWTDFQSYGSHRGECTFGPPCPECGEPSGACDKHASAMAARQKRMDAAIAAVTTHVE